MDINLLWALVIGFALTMYVLFDGFDLGVGLLLPFARGQRTRTRMLNTIYPVWDGNETWIVLAGVGLFGGFPVAYSILLPAFYLPLIGMILSLALRGVALEFRFSAGRSQPFWDGAFSAGSLGAALMQGLILGSLLNGVPVEGHRFAGSPLSFLTPFSVLTALTLPFVYTLAGTAWLHLKTEGAFQGQMRQYGMRLTGLVGGCLLGLLVAGHYYLPFAPASQTRRLTDPLSVERVVLLILLFGSLFMSGCGFVRSRERATFGWVMGAMGAAAVLLLSVLWPYIVPPSITIWDAASPAYGKTILLYGALFVIPFILSYLAYSYYVFRGKVGDSYEADQEARQAAQDRQLEQIQTEAQGSAPGPVRPLGGLARLGIALTGILLFFLIIGPFGETVAWVSLVLAVVAFSYGWYRSDRQESETTS